MYCKRGDGCMCVRERGNAMRFCVFHGNCVKQTSTRGYMRVIASGSLQLSQLRPIGRPIAIYFTRDEQVPAVGDLSANNSRPDISGTYCRMP